MTGHEAFHNAIAEIEKGQLGRLSPQRLQSCKENLSAQSEFGLDKPLLARRQKCLDAIDREFESRLRQEKEDRTNRESKDADKKRLRRQDVAILIAIVFGLISAAGVIYNIFLSKVQRANTEGASPQIHRQTPARAAAPKPAARSTRSTPLTRQTATAQPSAQSEGKPTP